GANRLAAEGKQVRFFCVGRKGYEQLRRQFERQIVDHVELRSVRVLQFEHARNIAARIVALYDAGEFDVCTLFFSRFKSVIAQIRTAQQIIPAVFPEKGAAAPTAAYEYEPEAEAILTELLPQNPAVQIFRAPLGNNASFYAAPMSAIGNATRNSGRTLRKQ